MDWYPWGEQAFQRARAEDKPILLSIGYSSCHWCHVMERESFENEQTARLMNDNFVSIKVDREERPDLDHIYMEAVQAITGQGGWPLTVFLTPKGEPFFGGTYFPPQDAHGLLGFPKILKAVADAYLTQKDQIAKSVEAIRSHLQQVSHEKPPAGVLSEDVLKQGYSKLAESFDRRNGGFGGAPKFPQPMALEFLLRFHHRTSEPRALAIVEHTLQKMAAGGIYDQLGGGFHRYATDAVWLVPHFEKMLYDNALLSRVYLHAYQVTGRPEYRDIATGTLDYVLREMTSSEGGFYSAQDADSDGEEGKYYLWTPEEIQAALSSETPQVASIVMAYFGITTAGNYDGKNILHVSQDVESLAKEHKLDPAGVGPALLEARKLLLAAREKRLPPGRDEKVLAGWNGLMIASMAEAGRVLDEHRYLEAAAKSASFLLSALWHDGKLRRTYTVGEAKVTAFLEDYASVAGGLLVLYEATLEHRWLEPVLKMAAVMLDEFWDEAEGTFFDTGRSGEVLVARPRNIFDNAIPCGGSQAAGLLFRLGLLTGNDEFTRFAARAMGPMVPYLKEHPLGFANWLSALDFHLSRPLELVIAGPPGDARTLALLRAAYNGYLPNKVIAGRHEGTPPEIAGLPIMEGREMLNGVPTAYPCQAHRCLEPATSPEALAARITSLQQHA